MRLSYQIATPDVRPAPGVTAYQGELERSFQRLQECGYDGAELMVADPGSLDAAHIQSLSSKYGLPISMVCTGEVFGQDGLCFSDTNAARRKEAIKRAKDAIDLAHALDSMINIGRARGGYMFQQPPETCIQNSIEGLREVADYGREKNVVVALEPVNAIACNFINTTQEGLEMIEQIGNPMLRLMLDSNHMFINDMDMIQSVYDAKEQVCFVHIVDSNRLYPGNCKLDFAAFIRALKHIGYDGWLSVEVFQRPDQDTALQRSIAYMKELFAAGL